MRQAFVISGRSRADVRRFLIDRVLRSLFRFRERPALSRAYAGADR
jgi:hypothetical protein